MSTSIKYLIYAGPGYGNDSIVLIHNLTAYGINRNSNGWFDCTDTLWDYMIGEEDLAVGFEVDKDKAVKIMRINKIDERYVKEVEKGQFPEIYTE